MPSSSEHVAALETGLSRSWVRQVATSGGGSVHRYGGLLVALSGVPDQTQQVAVAEAPMSDPIASVVAAESAFGLAGWTPAFDLVDGAQPDLVGVLSDRGYGIVADRPGMIKDLSEPNTLGTTGPCEVRPATRGDIAAIAEIQAAAFGIDRAVALALLPATALHDRTLEVLVASEELGGPVVGVVTVHHDGDVAGLIGAAVAPGHQGRGIGTALAQRGLTGAASTGASLAWLQSTTAGEALWTRCGFVEVGRCQVWLASHNPDPELHQRWIPTGL